MPDIRIGVACPIPGERAAFLEWLTEAGYDPAPMLDLDSAAREIGARPVEALIADAALVPPVELPRIVRILGPNRPLVLVGATGSSPETVPRDATWMERPVTRDGFLLSVALALAEGRPARRSPRKLVPQLRSMIDGLPARLIDVSAEGVRLEMCGTPTAALPPYFTLQVPGFGVVTKVKRVWVAMPTGAMWCGGILDKAVSANARTNWQSFVEAAPSTSTVTEVDSRLYR